jgi:protein-disulfide isomerase-like protein with CxxC motif
VSPAVVDTVLAGLNVDAGLRDAIIEDLIEERAEWAAAHGERSADRWVRQQTLRSVPVFVLAAVRDGDSGCWPRSLNRSSRRCWRSAC